MGRDLHLITVTAADVDDRDKATVWLQARQHAWESGTSYVMEGALRFITSDDPKARALRRRAVFVFTPMVNPDGCATGQVRFNANGFDVNRHWDEVNLRRKRFLTRMPEIWYVKKAIASHLASGRKIDLMINLHNTETSEYLSTRARDEASRAVVCKLSDRLVRETTFRPSRGPVLGEDPDSSANALHTELGILILLMEQRIANDPQHRPAADRRGPPPLRRTAHHDHGGVGAAVNRSSGSPGGHRPSGSIQPPQAWQPGFRGGWRIGSRVCPRIASLKVGGTIEANQRWGILDQGSDNDFAYDTIANNLDGGIGYREFVCSRFDR